MLIIEQLSIQNFLSVGDEVLRVDLRRAKTTLVVGVNGAGKSGTILDSLSFALFGKPFRKINKNAIVNSITGKNLLVECRFRTPSHAYVIRRGAKPNLFEIYRDNKLIEPPADLRDHQEWLETHVLRMNHRVFTQVIALGTASYVPFMQLPAHTRREVIEELLDIRVFSTMNTLLRDRVSTNADVLDKSESALKSIEAQVALNKRHVESMRQDNDALIASRVETIELHRAELSAVGSEAVTLHERVEEQKKKLVGYNEVQARRNELAQRKMELTHLSKELNRRLEFFQHTNNCPTCEQAIDGMTREYHTNTIVTKALDLKKDVEGVETTIIEFDREIENYRGIEIVLSQLQSAISQRAVTAREKLQFIAQLETDVEKLKKRDEVFAMGDDATVELDAKLVVAQTTRDAHRREQEILSAASGLLKDGGIKARVVRQYVPVLNSLIAKYLAALDFFVDFRLDEEFSETIKSRYRDDFSYESFSEGEKARIDLALLFAWRAVAKLRNSAHCNVLVLDEVLDSSLDALGAEEFIKIINSATDSENVFVISHRGDTLADKFERVLKFTKVKNFTQLETE